MSYADKTLKCRDCAKAFVFTAGEQEFYAGRGLLNEPGRCPDCRSARKAHRSGSGSGAGDRGQRQPREMHAVTCANCGVQTEVPFQPRQDKPVYCSDCYSKVKTTR